ncbi:MAG: aminotransferase class I/II-fold pyridoxal phosphate-dependent enzyme [Deltaproteobacteria bacterium]|nr:aminotransferase class I/II-fold pyridoxal phosphate-dependent enzyme [Deltaproteobacteria bacterium]
MTAQDESNRPDRLTFLPFSLPSIGEEEIAEVVDSLRSGWITTGPKTERFEKEFADYVGAKYAVGLSSATAGLHLSLKALGVGPGDEVITTPMTFAATVNMIVANGATPVFADIDPQTLQIDPVEVEKKVTEKTKAIVPVHFAGQPVDLDAIHTIAKIHHLTVLEDAAHAVGTEYKGKRIGALSELSVFSFHPIKNITTGEGGMVTTNDEALAERVRLLKFHGISKDAWKRYDEKGTPHYDVLDVGFKYNMMDLQAALGIHQLKKADAFNARRSEMAARYNEAFAALEGIDLPGEVAWPHRHAWHLYVIFVRPDRLGLDRDGFMAALKEAKIGTGIHFIAVHLHRYYREHFAFRRGDLPHAESISDRILSLPLFPGMTGRDQEDVIRAVRKICQEHRRGS